MKKAILGTKLGMTQMFREDGTMIPVTVVLAGPCPVVQKKSVEHDGYEAVQVAFKPIREKLCTKPMLGHFKKAGVEAHRYTREFKFDDTAAYEVGFEGNIKRWNQGRGRKTHGSHSYRVPGSMGACTYPGEVFKTKHLPGHMGSERVTVQNLEVVRVDADRNLLLVKGAIPGAKGSLVTVRETVK